MARPFFSRGYLGKYGVGRVIPSKRSISWRSGASSAAAQYWTPISSSWRDAPWKISNYITQLKRKYITNLMVFKGLNILKKNASLSGNTDKIFSPVGPKMTT